MSSPQEQFAELTRRTQENFKNLWQQWSERSTELMKGLILQRHLRVLAGQRRASTDVRGGSASGRNPLISTIGPGVEANLIKWSAGAVAVLS